MRRVVSRYFSEEHFNSKSKCYDIDFNHFVFGNLATFLFWTDVFNAAAVFFK